MNISSCNYLNLSSQDNLSLQMYSNLSQDQDDHNSNDLDHQQHQQQQEEANNIASSLLYNLSTLKEKVHQLQTLLSIILSPNATTTNEPSSSSPPSSSPSIAIAAMNMHNTIQEIIMTSSSMLLTIQHQTTPIITLSSGNPNPSNNIEVSNPSSTNNNTVLDWTMMYGQDDFNNNNSTITTTTTTTTQLCPNNNNNNNKKKKKTIFINGSNHEIIELDAADLLAKYTHYCRVCGKGFKRDANLRMHMRAHGDEYKTSAALTNPAKKKLAIATMNGRDSNKKYSCPQEGCRWNQRHSKFQPLKSMICAKNHYKRSHCPKMYVCKRCNAKQFSVLSDLRTHEKHCGDLKWQCSCGTTFSRKDKLMGHVSLFHGHSPIHLNNNNNNTSSSSSSTNINRIAKIESQLMSQAQIDSLII